MIYIAFIINAVVAILVYNYTYSAETLTEDGAIWFAFMLFTFTFSLSLPVVSTLRDKFGNKEEDTE